MVLWITQLLLYTLRSVNKVTEEDNILWETVISSVAGFSDPSDDFDFEERSSPGIRYNR